MAEGGEAGEANVGGGTSVGGSSASTGGKPGGKAGSGSIVGSGEAGESSGTSGGSGHSESADDDGGCSVSTSAPATKGQSAALFGFGLAMLGLVRRRRSNKQ
jgi:MYXO-CTERM domain-containing protein